MNNASTMSSPRVGVDSPASSRRLPELLAPAGDWTCAKAAVENGADAIYFGLEKFNARMRAHNFTVADLPRLMEFLHLRGVKGYVTFNTLVFEDELAEATEHLHAIIRAGVDAAIVQDVGICRLIRQLSPDFPIHVSTQMTITSAAGIKFARDLGCDLVVLARECSLQDIDNIRHEAAAGGVGLPIEVFVHGALCVAYSGQCLTSEALGGRSANRGECAQACRMPYELLSDGKLVPLGERKYLLSPQDLAGLEVLPELARSGVASLKIEGRLKSPEYVANITRVYRTALDKLDAAGEKAPGETTGGPADARYELEMAFSRGLFTGWFRGTNNQKLVHARFGKKRGVYLGEVLRVKDGQVILELQAPVKAGDGVVFDAGHPEQAEEGGRVYKTDCPRTNGSFRGAFLPVNATLWFGHGDIDFNRVHIGDKIWKTSDPELDRRLRQTFEKEAPNFKRGLLLEVHGREGVPMTLVARDETGLTVKAESSTPLAPAANQPLDNARLTQQLGRLGASAFRLEKLENFLEGDVMLPVSELNRLRRKVVGELETLRAKPRRWTLIAPSSGHETQRSDEPAEQARLIVLVRDIPQLHAAIEAGESLIYCEFENPKRYREAVSVFRTGQAASGRAIFVAPPRISKPGEEWILNQVRSAEADGCLARNYDHLFYFASQRCVGDFSLNVANHLSAAYFKSKFGLERLTASYDLNFPQLESLVGAVPAGWLEVTIHQHIPMFHMEHCVFCAFLSEGTDYRNCGRPCDHHKVKLRDRVGAEHALKADAGCRNTVFNSMAQTGAEYVARMMTLGVRHFRIEFLEETAEQVGQTIRRYQELLAGKITGQELWRELRLRNQLGVTRGQMAG